MTIDRRGFLYAGGLTAAVAMPVAAQVNPAASGPSGRVITDFGVEPNVERDQTEAIQKAIDDLTRLRQPVLFPGGVFTVSVLTIPQISVIGVPGMTVLKARQLVAGSGGDAAPGGAVAISGMMFAQDQARGDVFLDCATVAAISACAFVGSGKTAIKLGPSPATIRDTRFSGWTDPAIVSASQNLAVSACHFERCGVGLGTYPGAAATVTANRFDECAIGAVIAGTATLTGNIITKAAKFGLKLGSGKGPGHIVAQANIIRDCRIGVAVAASGEDIMCALNMISAPKDGAIRAFDGDKLVGPDLARQSAEPYLNLMVSGNVVR